jgi:RNA polymerase sigma-70 factor, ECF subfamily
VREGDVTLILSRASQGDKAAFDALLPLVYSELRRLAAAQMNDERTGHSLQTTGLIHEAYMRIVAHRELDAPSRGAFFAIAATTMRRILVDHARARDRLKRGGGARRVRLTVAADVQARSLRDTDELDVLALHDALDALAIESPRHARLVELRFFVGMGVDEAAAALNISPRQAADDWRVAKAFLAANLDRAS